MSINDNLHKFGISNIFRSQQLILYIAKYFELHYYVNHLY